MLFLHPSPGPSGHPLPSGEECVHKLLTNKVMPHQVKMGWHCMPPCYTASTVKKYILILSLLLAVPAFSQKAKPTTPDEMKATIKNLEDTVVEQQERLKIHKQEIDALRKTVLALESRLASLEKTAERRATTPSEIELAKQ